MRTYNWALSQPDVQTLGQLVQAVLGARFENSLMLTKAVMERHALDTTTALTRYKHQTLHMLQLWYQFTIFRDCLFLCLLCCWDILLAGRCWVVGIITDLYHHFRYKFKISPTLIWSPTAEIFRLIWVFTSKAQQLFMVTNIHGIRLLSIFAF